MLLKKDHVQKRRKNDLISVIIPVYKVEKYLDECVQSLVNQTYKNIEIVLVDDGSPDNCPKMCDDWAKKDSRIKVIHNKQNCGPQNAVINGIKASKGNLIGFLDSDDFVKPEFVEKLYEGIAEADVCCCGYIEKHLDKEIPIPQSDQNIIYTKGMEFSNLAYLLLNKAPCRWNKIFKRNLILDSIKFLNLRINNGEDVNLSFYVFANANKISFITDCLVYYRQIESSLSFGLKDKWDSFDLLKNQLLIINKECNSGLEDFIYNFYVFNFIKYHCRYLLSKKTKNEIKNFLNSNKIKSDLNRIKVQGIKQKIILWAMKHRMIYILKLCIKK